MNIFLLILVPITFYLIGRWLNKDEREAEKIRMEKYRIEQGKLEKEVIVKISIGEEKKEIKSSESFFRKNWEWIAVILFLLSPVLITLFKYFVLGIRSFGEGPDPCWGGQSCY